MSGYQQPRQLPTVVRLGQALHRYFFAERAISDDGVGLNLAEAIVLLARATDRDAAAREAELAWMRDRFGE